MVIVLKYFLQKAILKPIARNKETQRSHGHHCHRVKVIKNEIKKWSSLQTRIHFCSEMAARSSEISWIVGLSPAMTKNKNRFRFYWNLFFTACHSRPDRHRSHTSIIFQKEVREESIKIFSIIYFRTAFRNSRNFFHFKFNIFKFIWILVIEYFN